jgi:hypothetical protein
MCAYASDDSSNEPFLFMCRDYGTDRIGRRLNHEPRFRIYAPDFRRAVG